VSPAEDALAAAAPAESPDTVIVRELERRIRALSTEDEATFGAFTALDWAICLVGFVVLPLVLIWWAA
jgi:hypothetical protein